MIDSILRYFHKLYVKRQSFRFYDMKRDMDCDTCVSFSEVDGVYLYFKKPKETK